MLDNKKISPLQFGLLVVVFTIGSSILLTPSGLAGIAMQDAWIASLVGIVISMMIIILFSILAKLYPRNTFVEYYELIFGKWIGKIMAVPFIYFSFIGASGLLFNMGNFMVTQIMPETPIEVFNTVFALVILYGLRLGIEVIARTAEIFFPWMVLLILLLVIAVIPQIEITRIQPILEADVKTIIHGAIVYASISGMPCIVFAMLIPSLHKLKSIGKTFVTANIIGGIVIAVITFTCIGVLGADVTSRAAFPSYVLAKKISVADFMERIEVIVAIIWFITLFFKLTLYFYASILGTVQILGLSDYRTILIPFGLLVVIHSLIMYPNTIYEAEFNNGVWVLYALTIGVFLPIVLLVISKMKQKMKAILK